MAWDVLAVPISTVASEATFSVGGRFIDPYRASLSPDTVQTLVCGGDYMRKLHGIKKKPRKVSARAIFFLFIFDLLVYIYIYILKLKFHLLFIGG